MKNKIKNKNTMCHSKYKIGIEEIKKIFKMYDIELLQEEEYYFVEKYDWPSDKIQIIQVVITDDQDIANVLNIPLEVLHEEMKCLAIM